MCFVRIVVNDEQEKEIGKHRRTSTRGGGALNSFSGRGVRPGFPKCGACELTFASERGGGACERKISKFGGL